MCRCSGEARVRLDGLQQGRNQCVDRVGLYTEIVVGVPDRTDACLGRTLSTIRLNGIGLFSKLACTALLYTAKSSLGHCRGTLSTCETLETCALHRAQCFLEQQSTQHVDLLSGTVKHSRHVRSTGHNALFITQQ
jgi:hypothetical protein